MEQKRTREDLISFLDYLGSKGLMAGATVQARKAAASKILGILDPDEAADVTALDLDQVVARFHHLKGKDYTPGSLSTYKSRLASAIEDFRSYLANPLAFRPSIQNRDRQRRGSNQADERPVKQVPEPPRAEARVQPIPPAATSILPIPLRADLTIFIQGLPFDLTESEAKKIANVVTAMAT